MSLTGLLKKNIKPVSKKRTKTLWKGPEVDGITFSMLSRFLCCRERFRLKVIEGLEPTRMWNHRTGYGDMWHVCEEALASYKPEDDPADPTKPGIHNRPTWEFILHIHAKEQMKLYPLAQEQINHWYEVCKVQFPLYVQYWKDHPDIKDRTPLLQEQVFNIPYELPSSRVVKLRGKWDSADLVNGGVWLMENKTKGDIKELQLQRQLTFDLQTMLYIVALSSVEVGKPAQFAGVRYNVVRRPLSGGKGTIKQHQPTKSNPDGESKEEFYNRLRGIIEEAPETYFMRWNVPITKADIDKFRKEHLNPILENLCDWFAWVEHAYKNSISPFGNYIHWRHPFGVYNSLDEGGSSDLDEYLATGSEIGLMRVDELFPELKE